jgi:hypothetical protein
MARCAGVISERLAFKAAISLYFSLLTGNFAAENRFAQACLHRQPVWDLLSPAAHGPKSIILRAEKRKRLGDRDLQPLLIASSRAKPTIFLRRQVGWFPFAGGQSHGTSFAKARREPSVRPDYALPISLGLSLSDQLATPKVDFAVLSNVPLGKRRCAGLSWRQHPRTHWLTPVCRAQ